MEAIYRSKGAGFCYILLLADYFAAASYFIDCHANKIQLAIADIQLEQTRLGILIHIWLNKSTVALLNQLARSLFLPMLEVALQKGAKSLPALCEFYFSFICVHPSIICAIRITRVSTATGLPRIHKAIFMKPFWDSKICSLINWICINRHSCNLSSGIR